MLRDKDYIRTKNNLLFNVTGYQHPDSHFFASLKYVGDQKWTAGYAAALEFLRTEHPDFAGKFIHVPKHLIAKSFQPTRRWRELQRANIVSPLHREALELGNRLSGILDIPGWTEGIVESCVGITDSLLWGEGHEESDIDLVVVGLKNAAKIRERGHLIYDSPGFDRPDPSVMRSPYGLRVDSWPAILARKLHMGSFQGRLFSLRAVLSYSEIRQLRYEESLRAVKQPDPADMNQSIQFRIEDNTRSLIFPAVYRDSFGNELVDYSVVYEGVFDVGDVVRCECQVERVERISTADEFKGMNRYVINGLCELVQAANQTTSRRRPVRQS